MNGILGKKIGMTQLYREDGTAVPVTVLRAGPCVVVQRKSSNPEEGETKSDGYDAVQIGLIEGDIDSATGELTEKAPRNVNEPRRGHFAKAGVEPTRWLAEFSVGSDDESKPGDRIAVDIFKEDDYVDVIGTGKGKGFQGVMKRHGFGGGRATHGSMFHRAPGSIGQSAYPARVFPGIRLPGQTGGKRITTKNLLVVKVDEKENLLFVRGSVPGARNSYVRIRRSHKAPAASGGE